MKHRIVIVDDDADDRDIARDAFLSSPGEQEFIFFESGDGLLSYLEGKAEEELPSLILLDLNMPGKDGRETLKEIKNSELFARIPTLIFTTSSSQRDRVNAYELGANCFITKPDTFDKLVDVTKSISRLWLH
jgi:CheY-like chemotaxis protein